MSSRGSTASASVSGEGSPPSPRAQRLRRPRWTDARLLVGAVLVLGSTVAGASLLGGQDAPQHWVAARDLPSGHALALSDLRPVEGESPEGVYLTGDAPVAAGEVLLRPVPEGRFVAREDVGPRSRLDLRRVAVEVTPGSAAMLSPGETIDLWATPAPVAGDRERPRPRHVLRAVEVARVQGDENRVAGAAAAVPVDLLVPAEEVESLLEAIGGEAEVTAVPVTGDPSGRGAARGGSGR